MNPYQLEYFGTWQEAFAQFLGWTEAEITSWAKSRLEDLAIPGVVLNEPPLFYVAREIAYRQSYYDDLSPRQRGEFIRCIQDVLAPDRAGRNFPSGFDFEVARKKINSLISTFAQDGTQSANPSPGGDCEKN